MNRFVTVHKKTSESAKLYCLGVAGFLYKHTALQVFVFAGKDFNPSFERSAGCIII